MSIAQDREEKLRQALQRLRNAALEYIYPGPHLPGIAEELDAAITQADEVQKELYYL